MATTHVIFSNKLIPADKIHGLTPVRDNSKELFVCRHENWRNTILLPLEEWSIKPALKCGFAIIDTNGASLGSYFISAPVPKVALDELESIKDAHREVYMLPATLEHLASEMETILDLLLDEPRARLSVEPYRIYDDVLEQWRNTRKVIPKTTKTPSLRLKLVES